MTVNPRLAQLIAETFLLKPEQISPSLSIGMVEKWDSMGHIELVLRLEETFKIRFPTEEIPQLKSVAIIQAALNAKEAL